MEEGADTGTAISTSPDKKVTEKMTAEEVEKALEELAQKVETERLEKDWMADDSERHGYAGLSFVWREDWGSTVHDWRFVSSQVCDALILAFTDTPPCHDDDSCALTVRELQQKWVDLHYGDLPWNFMIGGNGKIYEGTGLWHCTLKAPDNKYAEYNYKSRDFAFIGSSIDDVTPEMRSQYKKLMAFSTRFAHLLDHKTFGPPKLIKFLDRDPS